MDPTTAITVAIIAFAGVLVGGLIAAGANFILSLRRERVEDAREHQRRRDNFLVACRLVHDELLAVCSFANFAGSERRWRHTPQHFKVHAWQKHSPVMASHLSDEEWTSVMHAYFAIELISDWFIANNNK